MRKRTLALVALLLAVWLTGCRGGESGPRNVVLMIGDGMGITHVTAAKVAFGELHMERMPVAGLCMTHAADALVTDSAASGTALATGKKTYNGAVSVDPESRAPIETVAEEAEALGMATGLVVTCSVVHATPAVFVAHVDDRGKYIEIAEQIAESGLEVLFGGGSTYFLPDWVPGGSRRDGEDLVDRMRQRMAVALTESEFRELGDVDAAAALLWPEHPPTVADRSVSLAELTRKALEILSRDPDGFFLMVEGAQIDWAGHENMQDWLVNETRDFDDAVGVALDFAEDDGGTLVVVTADHECGGFALVGGSVDEGRVESRFASVHHTAAMVPVLATGPGSERFGGIKDNTEIGELLSRAVVGR